MSNADNAGSLDNAALRDVKGEDVTEDSTGDLKDAESDVVEPRTPNSAAKNTNEGGGEEESQPHPSPTTHSTSQKCLADELEEELNGHDGTAADDSIGASNDPLKNTKIAQDKPDVSKTEEEEEATEVTEDSTKTLTKSPPESTKTVPDNDDEDPVRQAGDAVENEEVTEVEDLKAIEERKIGGDIIFHERCSPVPSPSEEWTNLRWLSTNGERKVKFCDLCSRVVSVGRRSLLWREREEFQLRKIAVYEEPNLILILRAPQDASEVRHILELPTKFELNVDDYLVAETVIDPITCKLRLSPLTTVTSIESSSSAEGASARRRGCFELITPLETILMSAFPPDAGSDVLDNSIGFLETKSMEVAIGNALFAAHTPSVESLRFGVAWKHQLVLGSLASFVVSGSQRQLEKALAEGIKHNADSSTYVPTRVIDQLDESGRTALHYACERRASGAVTMLIGAGADCTISVSPGDIYPCHLSAMRLDEKSLSTILSASYPRRPNPNVLDAHGRTAMYVAATIGKSTNGGIDGTALGRCLSALEVWGGVMMADKSLRHPVSLLASNWSHEAITPVLAHTPHRFPLPAQTIKGMSLGALYHYPIHSALISLRKSVVDLKQGAVVSGVADWRQQLSFTLESLVRHGFEPNERIDGRFAGFDSDLNLREHVGYTPLQILAAAALDLDGIDGDTGVLDKIGGVIAGVAEFMITKGGRLNVDPPPTNRLNRSASSLPIDETKASVHEQEQEASFPEVDRAKLKIEGNKTVLSIFGGEGRLRSARKLWADLGAVPLVRSLSLTNEKDSFANDLAPGGSDERSCAICWRPFGSLLNRKQKCRVTLRYICDDCSGKRVITAQGKEERVSDGQFHVARADKVRQAEDVVEQRREQLRAKTERLEKARARREALEREEEAQREGLFGGIINKATALMMGEEDTQESVEGLQSTLGQTRDALNERGERLNALSEKTARLVDASDEFARMAKQLEQSQKGGLFW